MIGSNGGSSNHCTKSVICKEKKYQQSTTGSTQAGETSLNYEIYNNISQYLVFPVSVNANFICSGQKSWFHLWLLFLSHLMPKLSANPFGSIFKYVKSPSTAHYLSHYPPPSKLIISCLSSSVAPKLVSLLLPYPPILCSQCSSDNGPFKTLDRASLVAQWLRICLLMQGTRVRALVWEDPTCHGAAGPVSHNY